MRLEKRINYAGFEVALVKEDTRSPYILQLDAHVNHRPYLPKALEETGWRVDVESFRNNKPIWTQPLVGPSMTGMTNQTYSYIESLYTAQRRIELDELRKQRELLGLRDIEEDICQ